MKNQLIIPLLLSILFLSCQTEIKSTSSAVSNTEKDSIVEALEIVHPDTNTSSPNQIDSSIHEDQSREIATLEIPDTLILNDSLYFLVDTVSASDYEQVSYMEEEYDIYEKFCKTSLDSFYYRYREYDYSYYNIMGTCFKEIEKLKLSKLPKSNIGSIPYGLKIIIDSGDTLIYDGFVPSMPDRSGGYSFFDYIELINSYLIRVHAFESCSGFILINLNSGDELYWDGRPYFSNEKNKLILVGDNSSYCKREFSYWKLKEKKFEKIGFFDMTDWYFISDIRWINSSSFVGKITFNYPYSLSQEFQYLKMEIIELTSIE